MGGGMCVWGVWGDEGVFRSGMHFCTEMTQLV